MTEHETIQAMLTLAAAGALDPAELAQVQRHAETCEACRKELAVWGSFTRGLAALPQPILPPALMERTRARVLEQKEASANTRLEAFVLAGLAVFGWLVGTAAWSFVRILFAGSLPVMGMDLAKGWHWFLFTTVLAWMTAASAAAVLGKRNETERTL